MSETNKATYHWAIKLSVIGGSAISSAVGSAFLSLAILAGFLWGDGSVMGIILGFPTGFLVGGGVAFWLLSKQLPIWKVIIASLWAAALTTSLLTAGFNFLLV